MTLAQREPLNRFLALTALSILLSVGVAQADTPQRIGGDAVPDCLMWVDKDSGIQTEGAGCRQDLPKPGCYQKMRDAIRKMKAQMQPNPNSRSLQRGFIMTEEAWEREFEPIYQECVK
jgi:hypothetical protein